MAVSIEGKVTSERFKHPSKRYVPKDVTLSGIIIEVIPVLLNA